MKRYFVDSNIFLRFFVRDDENQRLRVRKLFREAENGAIELVTGPPVLFETAWTLRSTYHVAPEEILSKLSSINSMSGLEIIDRDLVEGALSLSSRTGCSFPDAYIAVSAVDLGADGVATFNVKDFRKAGTEVFVP